MPLESTWPSSKIKRRRRIRYLFINSSLKNWKNFGMTFISKDIICWNIPNYLRIGRNNQQNIIKQITHISFPNLKQLVLSFNQIESMEELATLYSPLLQILNIQGNLTKDLKCLRKCSFPRLNKFIFSLFAQYDKRSRFLEIERLSQMICSKDCIFYLPDQNLEKGRYKRAMAKFQGSPHRSRQNSFN